MNAPNDLLLPDVQASGSRHGIVIDDVGIRAIRYPVSVATAHGGAQGTIAEFDMYVALPAAVKGTHMSRFVEMLESVDGAFSPASFRPWLEQMVARLDAQSGMVVMRFPYFVTKHAPVSGVASLLDYQVRFEGRYDKRDGHTFTLQVEVPVTSLCPCSKQISEYGAHNQRSHITLRAELRTDVLIEDLIAVAERAASCELYGLLKRPDEKFVTERAYDNPKFVEDLVRDIARDLIDDARIGSFEVCSENFESIHNHSAFARIRHSKPCLPA